MVKSRSNPNGTLWANNKDKLGAKLLAKWGWQEGKGLGKNENGMTEHVKVTKKDDNTGVGTTMNVSSWTGNTSRFDDTLARLAGSPKKKSKRKKRATSACSSSSESSAASIKDVYIPRSPKVGATNLMSNKRIYNRKRIAAKSEIKSNVDGRKIIVGKRPDEEPVHPKDKKPEKVDHTADQLTEIQHFAAVSMSDYFAQKAAQAGEVVETTSKTDITSFAAFNAGLSSGKTFDREKEVAHIRHHVERKQARQARREARKAQEESELTKEEKASKEKKQKKEKKEKKDKKDKKDKKEKKKRRKLEEDAK